jgi:hypothetical protein
MINDISTNPIPKRFDEIERIFFYGNHVWVKIPEVLDKNKIDKYNAYCFDNGALRYFSDDSIVLDPDCNIRFWKNME